MDLWLSEIDENSIVLHEHPEAPVSPYITSSEFHINFVALKLVRYDAPRIGCAEIKCDGKKSTLCLIDRP
ncbi:hypothetical protein Y032_0030g2160 [Ancylostoma ceylanicum]|uniref:Uncharacterized protein n=1 Tax=Ancylostoma ceylanicum TaxID=53326 RepID=A0A016UQC4_9BILA|nr:hypothetical protein Y032_0030g2160 [Ancylostoma ceylanicum]